MKNFLLYNFIQFLVPLAITDPGTTVNMLKVITQESLNAKKAKSIKIRLFGTAPGGHSKKSGNLCHENVPQFLKPKDLKQVFSKTFIDLMFIRKEITVLLPLLKILETM